MKMETNIEKDALQILAEFEAFRDLVVEANHAVIRLVKAAARSEHPLGSIYLGMSAEELKALASMPSDKTISIIHTGVPLFGMRTTEQFLRNILSGSAEEAGHATMGLLLDLYRRELT